MPTHAHVDIHAEVNEITMTGPHFELDESDLQEAVKRFVREHPSMIHAKLEADQEIEVTIRTTQGDRPTDSVSFAASARIVKKRQNPQTAPGIVKHAGKIVNRETCKHDWTQDSGGAVCIKCGKPG